MCSLINIGEKIEFMEEKITDKILDGFKQDFIIGDYTVMASFINGDSVSLNKLTQTELVDLFETEFGDLSDIQLEVYMTRNEYENILHYFRKEIESLF